MATTVATNSSSYNGGHKQHKRHKQLPLQRQPPLQTRWPQIVATNGPVATNSCHKQQQRAWNLQHICRAKR